MNCWYCGSENKPGSKYCRHCGSFLRKGTLVSSSPEAGKPAAAPAVSEADTPATEIETAADETSERNTGKETVDVNNAAEEEIAALPGVGIAVAKRIISERNERGGFKSLEELAQVVGLKNYVKTRIRPLVAFNPMRKTVGFRQKGRVVDY